MNCGGIAPPPPPCARHRPQASPRKLTRPSWWTAVTGSRPCAGRVGEAEVVVGEQRGADRFGPAPAPRTWASRRRTGPRSRGRGGRAWGHRRRASWSPSWAWLDVPRGPTIVRGLTKAVRMAYLIREAGMADTTAAPTGGRAIVRPGSRPGLVREVSVRNALFYNTAAFIGITVAWAPVFYALAFVPVGKKVGFLTSYGCDGHPRRHLPASSSASSSPRSRP